MPTLYVMRLLLLVFLIHGIQPTPAQSQAQKGSEDANIQVARQRIIDLMGAQRIPGLAVAVSIGGKTIWTEGFGFADVEQQVRVNPEQTRFRIASISKPLTATGLGILMEQERIHPDTSVAHYLPWFPAKKYRPTIRQVAGHLGGIRHYRGQENFSSTPYPDVRSGIRIFENDSLINKPGTTYVYSSYGFNLISAAMESAAGEPFVPFMQRHVLTPLGMNNTTIDRVDSLIPFRGRYYEHNGKHSPPVDNSYKWAGGGYLSTATDLIRFGNSYLTGKLLQPSTIRLLTTSQQLADGKASGYGIGWSDHTDRFGRKVFGHSGGAVGGTSNLIVHPDSGMVIVILTNVSGASLGPIAEAIMNDLMPAPSSGPSFKGKRKK